MSASDASSLAAVPIDAPPPAPRVRRVSLAIGGVVLLGYLVQAAWFWPQINDDAFITFRYSRALLAGVGPYYNPGEHVEGYTNFLWMLLMTGAIGLFGPANVLFSAKLLSVLLGMATIAATAALGARWLAHLPRLAALKDALAWAAGAYVAASSSFALQSTTGLETILFAACIAVGLWLSQRTADVQRWSGAGVALGLAALTRPEGVLIGGVILAAPLLGGKRRAGPAWRTWLLDACLFAFIVAAHALLRYRLYDGELLPNTFYAKAGGFWFEPSAYLSRFAMRHLGGVAAVLAVLPVLLRPRLAGGPLLAGYAVLAAAVLCIFAAGTDWMPGYRLLTPYLPIWAALALVGACSAAERVRPAATLAGALLVAGLAGAIASEQPARRAYLNHVQTRARGYIDGHGRLADWLTAQTEPGDTIALMDIGLIGYINFDRVILDSTGLTDRTIAKSPGDFLDKQFDLSYLFDRKPRFIVIAMWTSTADRTSAAASAPADGVDLRQLKPWNPIEERILADPRFTQRYARPQAPDPDAPFLARLAAMIGAAAVFEHEHPGNLRYFLAAYRLH